MAGNRAWRAPQPQPPGGPDAPGQALMPPNRARSGPQASPGGSRRPKGRSGDPGKGGESGCLDLAHIDEAGFAMSLPTTTTWGTVGCPRLVPYEAPQGRRL